MNRANWNRFLFLLRREFLFQLDGRRSHARSVYPGVNWFALLCVGAILLEFNSSRLDPANSKTAVTYFDLLALGQVVLIGLRSTVYTAVSFARDLQSHTATVVRVTPVSRTASLLAKLCACLAPLWCELLLFLPACMLFFSVYLRLDPLVVFSVFPFLFAVSLLGGCLGLLVGSMGNSGHQAARNARLLVLFLFFFFPVLQTMSDGYLIPGLALGVWLLLSARRAPHRFAIWGSVVGLCTLLGVAQSAGSFKLSYLYPMYIITNFYSEAFEPGVLSHGPGLATIGLIYLALAGFCFLLAHRRYNHAR